MARKQKQPATTDFVYEFTITLSDIEPPIWRRVQVPDGTLDEFHQWIQGAMGWENAHLHEFKIGGKSYADPDMLEDSFDEEEMGDTLTARLSDVLGHRRKGFRFGYLYDFGDSWEHEIRYEGRRPADPEVRYPVCLEGARACPPEDCGGSWEYQSMLEALAHPEDEEYEHWKEWVGDFDPEAFSPAERTRAMQWRQSR
jgi:hypothetical protein